MKKFKELKQVYIPYKRNYEPMTDEDKISLEKSIRRLKLLLIIAFILFIVSFPITCILIYEFFTGNSIWLMNNGIKVMVWAF